MIPQADSSIQNMVKFDGENDPSYKAVLDVLKRIVRKMTTEEPGSSEVSYSFRTAVRSY